MKKQVYTFKIAFQTQEELDALTEQPIDPNDLELTTLPNGLPSYKTLYTLAESEDAAIKTVDAYVSKTPYKEIEDGKVI